MSQTPPACTRYRSAYHGAVLDSDGLFDHFARQLDDVHLKNGYWRFSTYEDDKRAYQRGFSNPEDVLIAQDVGDGVHDDILLRWVPGKSDTTNTKPSVGTASAHLETIYNERKLLGKSLAFKGRVPVYPVSDDQRLVNYRLTRYGIQKGALPVTTLQSLSRHEPYIPESLASSLHKDRPPSRALESASVAASTVALQQVKDGTVLPAEVTAPALLTPGQIATPPESPTPCEEPSTIEPPSHEVNLRNPLCIQQQAATALLHPGLHKHMPVNNSDAFKVLPTAKPNDLEEQSKVDAVEGDRASHMFSNSRTEGSFIPCLADKSSSGLQNIQSALLPCIDCGAIETHESQCWIQKATPGSLPIQELSAADLETFAESVARFDPGPWTTHAQTPLEAVDDPKTQIKGMAEIIRGLGIHVEHPELRGLSDQLMIIVWGLGFSGEVQSLRGSSVHSAVSSSDIDDVDMGDV